MNILLKKLFARHQETGVQFIKFALIGVLNTSIHYLVFLALYRAGGMHYLLSSAIGYCVGLFNSFLLNKIWTFKTVNVRKDIEFLKFVVVNMVSLLVNMITLQVAVTLLHLIPEVGQIIAIILHTCTNFVGNKYWTFYQIKKNV